MPEPLQRALAKALEQSIVRESAQDPQYSGPTEITEEGIRAVYNIEGGGYGAAEPYYESALFAERPVTGASGDQSTILIPEDVAVRVHSFYVQIEAQAGGPGDVARQGVVMQRRVRVEGLTTLQPIPLQAVGIQQDDNKTYVFGAGQRQALGSPGQDFPKDSTGFIYVGGFGADDAVRGVYPEGHALEAFFQYDTASGGDIAISAYVGGLEVPTNTQIPTE